MYASWLKCVCLGLLFGNLSAQTTIAVIDFDARNISADEVATLTDRFRDELTKTKRYTVVERGKMQEVLQEQGFQQSGCVSDECVVEAGKMLGVEQMVGGSIGKVGNVYTVSVRIIDVESGEIMDVTNYDYSGDIGQLLTEGMYNTVYQLIGSDEGDRQESQQKTTSPSTSSEKLITVTVTDIDGNTYKTVKIGDQWWMAENLKVTHYRNGDAIPNVTDSTEWSNLTTGAYCEYDNSSTNVTTYGRLYNWYTVNDSRNIAPEGWHVASDEEWKELEMALGMSQSEADQTGFRGTNEGSKLAGNADLWNDSDLKNNAAFGSSGFAVLPGGWRSSSSGYFYDMGSLAYFWSSAEGYSYGAWTRDLYYDTPSVTRGTTNKPVGFSVRLVRD